MFARLPKASSWTFCLLSFVASRAMAQFSPSPAFSDTVLRSFVQDAPNCASEAVAKTMIASYGLSTSNGVFLKQEKEQDGLAITLRNGDVVHVSKVDLDAAMHHSDFTLATNTPDAQAILNASNLIYAVIAVRAVAQGQGPLANLGSLDAVFSRLHKGVDADYLFMALGYTIADDRIGPDTALAYLFGNAVHAVFAMGTVFDQYGGPLALDQFQKKHPAHGPVWKYILDSTAKGSPTFILACKYKNTGWLPGKSCD